MILLGFQTEKRLYFYKKSWENSSFPSLLVSQIAKSIAKPCTIRIGFFPLKSRSRTWEMKWFFSHSFFSLFAGAVDVGGDPLGEISM